MTFLARRRVVSLVPSVTETLLAWGITPVAVTRFCEQPHLPEVGGTKDPAVPRIIEMKPDLVVMCDEENRIEDHQELRGAGLRVVSLPVESVADAVQGLARLAEVLELPRGLPGTVLPPEVDRPLELRAFVPVWRRPWMALTGQTYGASLLARLGVTVVGASGPDRYPEVTLESVATVEPDVVLAPSEPYPFKERHVDELSAVAPVVLVDGQDLFWWGVRTSAAQVRLHDQLSASAVSSPTPRPTG